MARIVRYALVCLLSSLFACDVILDIPKDPHVADAGSMGPDGAGADDPWACLEKPRSLPESALQIEKARVALQTCSLFAQGCNQLINGLTARLCSKLDAGCRFPLLDDFEQQQGSFVFDVPIAGTPFGGYLAIYSDREPCFDEMVFGDQSLQLCSLLPGCDPDDPVDDSCNLPRVPKSMFFFDPPVARQPEQPIALHILPMVSVYGLLAAGGGAGGMIFDADHGLLSANVVDCNGMPAAGVSIELDRSDEGIVLYFEDDVPTVRTMETDETGIAGVAGLSDGYVVVTGRLQDGRKVAEASVLMEGLAVSYVVLSPHKFQ